jgi:hypothetical protein
VIVLTVLSWLLIAGMAVGAIIAATVAALVGWAVR